MRQAIETRYYGPTNHRDARVRAKCDAKTIWVDWDYALESSDNHIAAATELAKQLNWPAILKSGSVGNGYYHILADFD